MHTVGMLARVVTSLIVLAIGLLPVAPEAVAFASPNPPHPGGHSFVRRPIMSAAERLKDGSFCHRKAPGTIALLPHAVADAPCTHRFIDPVHQGDGHRFRSAWSTPHTPRLPAAHRIRAP